MLFRTPKNQVSTPRPECGVGFDSSARAMNRSASKGSLMVHEYSHTTPAVKGILSFTTFSERKHMLKTLKRKIALVAVAGLGAGLISVAPASATDAATTAANINLTQTDSTLAVSGDNAAARAGVQTIKITEAAAVDTPYHVVVTPAACTASIADMTTAGLATLVAGTPVNAATPGTVLGTAVANAAALLTDFAIGKVVVVTPNADTTDAILHTITTSSLTAGTWNVCGDPSAANAFSTGGFSIGVITVNAGGAPASLSWAQSTRQISSTAVDYSVNVTPKDASGVSTVLVGAETFVLDVTPQTGVAASQVVVTDATISANEITATTGTVYAVTLDGNGSGGGGSTVAGTTYTLTAQLVTGGAAIGSPSSSTYTRVNNSAGLTGTITYSSDAAGTLPITALTATPAVATANFFARVKDGSGAVVVGATLAHSVSGVTDAALSLSSTSDAAGFTTARSVTPAAGGSGTYTSSLSTGSGTITGTLPITSTAFGATAALPAGVSVVATNGNGFKTTTAGTAYVASLTTTGFTVTVSGVDAGKTVKFETTGSTATTPKVGGIVSPAFAVADASGVVTIAASIASATTGQTLVVTTDGNGAGGVDVTTTITFTTATGALTTAPATATTSFAPLSSTQKIDATVADTYSNAVTGGSVTIVNTSAPATVTVAATVAKNVDSSGKASMDAIIGSVAGTYVFTVTARDANGGTIGTASTVTFSASADGAPSSVTLTAGGSEAGLGSFDVFVSPDGTPASGAASTAYAATADAAAILAASGGWVVMTVSVKNAAGTGVDNVAVSAKGSDGVFISNAVVQAAAPIDTNTKLSTLTSTSGVTAGGGVATFQVVPTKAGTNTVTFTVGTKTATATFKAKTGLATTSIARTVTLSGATVAVTGGAISQVTATAKDAFGNPAAGVTLTGTISGVAGRFAGGARTFAGTTNADGTVVFEVTANTNESGAGTLTVTGADAAANITNADFRTGDLSVNLSTLGKENAKSAAATLAVTAGVADSSSAQIKTDVATANAAVKALATQVTVLQASVATLIDSLTTQIASLMKSVSALTKAVAKLQKKK
jgi:hypothetical protein